MEEANDADGPNSGRKAHKKKILIIEDSDDDSVIECESENSQLTPKRKTNPPPMEGIVAEGSSEGSDDSSDDLDTENSGESSDGVSNDSNSDQNSNWTTDSEEDVDDGDVEDDDDDITQPSTSRACTRRSRRLIDSLSDEPIASGDELTPQSPTQSGEVHSISEPPGGRALNKRMRVDAGSAPKEQDNFQGSSSETDDGEGHAKTRCPICLRSLPGPSGGAEVGSPEGCQHLFCVCCIQEWAKNVNTCPVDRHEFSEIVVYEGVGGKEIRRLPLPKKPRCAGDALDDEDITLISQIEEDPTFCEVCGSGDREDSLLLCDGCDRGYHLDCLTPPLTSVPIEEWFCSTCTSNDASRQRACRATRNMRLLPRTSASQRVLRSLRRDAIVEQGRRGLRTWNIDSHDLELMEEMAELEVERRWAANTTGRPSTSRGTSNRRRVTRRKVYRRKTTTRKKRKTVTKKRLVKRGDGGEEEEEEEVEEEEVTTTSRRRRGKRRKGAGKKSRRGKKFLSKKKGRSRLAETLGLVPGKKGILLRKKGMCGRGGTGGAQGVGGGADGGAVINGAASGIGGRVPTLSIFGSRNDLEYFSDGSDVEGGGGSLAVASIPRPVDSVHAHQLAKERLISGIGSAAERRKALIKERALASASPSSGAAGRGVPDILGSIMESQSVWHGRKSKVKINSDGSLVVEKSKTSNPTQDTGRGDTSAVGPKSIETTNINNEMNVNSGTARVPSNPAEPSTTAQDSCSTFRDGSSGVEVRDSAASVETREEIDASIRPLWPVRTLDANSREESSSANRKDRIPSQNVNETHYANRAPSTTATQSVVTTSSRATNNFRSIEHLAGNVIVNSNRNYLDSADDGCRGRLWESQPTSSVKNDRSVISSGFISHVNPMHEGDVLSGAGSFGVYGFSPNSPLDLSSSSHKGDARELLHRNMYLDLSSGGGGSAGFGPAGYGAPYAGVSCEAVDMRVQSLPNASATAEDLRVAPIPGNSHHHVRSLSVIKENPSVESTSRSLTGPLCQDVHADIGDLPLPPSERVGASVVTPLEAVKTIGLPGSSGNGSTSQAMNSSVRDMGGGERASGGGGGARGGANQRLDYARANSSYGSGTRDANGSANGGSEGGGGGGGDQNDRPQVLKRHLDEDEEEEDDKDREEDEDVDIYSDIEPGGSDPPTDNIPERHGMPSHAIETPPDQGPMFHPFLLRGGSDKYDPAEPSRDTDDEMVIDEEGGNEEESLTPWSEGEALPPPPLPPTILDYIVESPVNLHGYDSDRSVTPTEEDERRKAVAAEDSEGQGRPPVGVRVYGILSQGKFGLGVHNYGSDDEDEGEDEGCPNFSIYSATSVNIARTAEAEGEDSSKEIEDASGLSEKVDESLKITRKSLSPTEEIANSEKESGEDQWNADQSVTSEDPPSSQEKEDILVSEKVTEDSSSEKEAKKEPEKSSPEKSSPEKSSPEKSSPEKSSPGKSSPEKSDAEDDPSLSKSDVDAEKSDAEAEAEKSSDLENEKSDDGAKSILSKSLEESLPNEEENNLDDEGKELRSEEMEEEGKGVDEEGDEGGRESGEGEAGESEPMGECERIRDIVVPELEGLETETISEAEEATAFEDLETSKRRSCGGEEEEGEIVDERARDKGMVGLDEKDVSEKDGDKDVVDQEIHKTDEGQKKEGKKEGKRRARKKADASKSGEATGSDAAIAWKKLSKLGKERNYREKGAEDPNQSKKELEDKEDKENRRGKKERDRRKGKRKDLERYDVRKVVGERSKTKRRRTDAFGRELRSNSKSRSRSRIFSRSRSRGARSRSRGGRSRSPRGRSRSHGAWSRSRGVRSRSRGRRSRSRGGRSRSRGPSKSRGRSRSRGKGRRSRSRSRARQRSRSKGGRSRSRGGRSRSRQRSRDRTARRGENAPSKATARKKSRRSHSPASERRKQSRSRSRQRKRSRSRRRRTEQSQGSWERSWTRSWSRSVTPIESRSLEKTRGHMRSRSMSGSRVLRDRSPMPMSRSPSCSRGRSFCRSPSTPTLPPPPRYRMGLQSISRSPSRSPERLRSPAVAAAVGASKKKRRKKEGKARKETDVGGKKRKKRRERSPAASKEVFASGDNILVSVSFKSAPKENSNMPKRRKASSPVEEKVKVMEEPAVDAGVKKKRKFMPVIKKKPSVIIDLETSPFVERVPSPADLIVLSDSSGENEDKGAKQLQQQQQQPMDSDIQRRHRMMILSPVPGQKTRGIGVKEKRVGAKLGKKGKLGKGKKGLGKKERKVAVAVSNAGIVPSEVVPLEEPQLPLSTPEEPPLERRLGPKTPPEPQVKFCIASKGSQLRSVNNPLREDDDEDEEDEIIASEAMAAAASQLELGQKVMVQGESEAIPQDVGIDGEIGESEAHQAVQVGPNTPPGPSTPILDGQFNEVDGGVSPIAPQEEAAVLSSSRPPGEDETSNKEGNASFDEPPSRKDQEMDTYDPFEPTNSPAPSPPAPETEPLGHQTAEESRDASSSAMAEGGVSQTTEEQHPVEEEAAVAEPKAEEATAEPTVEEMGPTPVQGSVQGVASIARTLGTTVGAIDAVGGLVLPLLAQLGAVAQPQPLNAAVAAVTSANSPIVQQQLSPLVNRAFPQQPQQAKAADVIRTLFGTGLRQFPEMVASSGAGGAFSVSQPKVSKSDLSLGGGGARGGKGGPRVAVTAPRVAVATPRVVVPTPRVAVTPRVATANGKDQAPGSAQDRVDVVDMDLESPYSPASSEGDDLFEPPSYESAGSARQTSVLGQQSQQSKKGSQRGGSAPSQDKFDNLFGSSPMRRNSGGGKGQSRNIKNHKGGGKTGKQRGKTGGKVNVRSEEDHHLTILDELPNSAVEMQVKEKFLIKLNRQERVVEEVKLALKPHYNKKHLSKDEYKDILRRSVPKICHNRSGEINPIKIRSLVEAYVRKFRYARKKDTAAAVGGNTRANKGKKPT